MKQPYVLLLCLSDNPWGLGQKSVLVLQLEVTAEDGGKGGPEIQRYVSCLLQPGTKVFLGGGGGWVGGGVHIGITVHLSTCPCVSWI